MYHKIIIVINLFLLSNFSFCQNINDSNSNIINQYFNIQNENEVSNILSNNSIQNNVVSVEIVQYGDYNVSVLETKANENYSVIQNGDFNFYETFSFYNSMPTEMQIVQNGNNNSLLIFGQNELSNQMQIIQNTNNQMLIIKNY
jgi:hypothetical protein